jgi:hypothetical protein
MPKYKLVVFTTPVPGRDQDYNDWYQNIHLRDLLAIDGFKSAQRFRLKQAVVPEPPPLPYLAIYEIETNDIDGAIKELIARAESGRIVVSDALSSETFCAAYEEFGPIVKA